MTVVIDGAVAKSEYRKFRLEKNIGNDDTKSLAELLRRRANHPEWGMPNLIVIDGGKGQLNAARKVISGKIVSVVKDDKHKAREILGIKSADKNLEKNILLANFEAHRFAIAYHRKLRGKLF